MPGLKETEAGPPPGQRTDTCPAPETSWGSGCSDANSTLPQVKVKKIFTAWFISNKAFKTMGLQGGRQMGGVRWLLLKTSASWPITLAHRPKP